MRASIALPRTCKARALPFELIPRRLVFRVGIQYFINPLILSELLEERYERLFLFLKLF